MAGAEITSRKHAPKYASFEPSAHPSRNQRFTLILLVPDSEIMSKTGEKRLFFAEIPWEKSEIRSEIIQICSEERKILSEGSTPISVFHHFSSFFDAFIFQIEKIESKESLPFSAKSQSAPIQTCSVPSWTKFSPPSETTSMRICGFRTPEPRISALLRNFASRMTLHQKQESSKDSTTCT